MLVYIIAGLLAGIGMLLTSPLDDGFTDKWERLFVTGVVVVGWPLVFLYLLWVGAANMGRAVVDAAHNKADLAENKRLKEELEALKDRLYELEP